MHVWKFVLVLPAAWDRAGSAQGCSANLERVSYARGSPGVAQCVAPADQLEGVSRLEATRKAEGKVTPA